MKKDWLSIALPKGRLAEETVELLVSKGVCRADVIDFSSRRLIFEDEESRIRFLMIRNMDVPTYVEHGAADFGVVGKDILTETNADVYEFMDLGFGYCRLCVAGMADTDALYRHDMKVATKYSHITKDFFAKKGIFVETIKLYGSIEIAPLVGLADYIVDLVSTGETLRKNGMKEVETLMESTARLVGNRNLVKAKYERVKEVFSLLEHA